MGLLKFLLNTLLKNDVSNVITTSKPPLPSEYYDFEDKYAPKIDAKYDNFIDSLDTIRESFDESYDYKKRLSLLNKAVKICDDFSSYLDSLGPFASIYFSDMYGSDDYSAPDSYCVDFDFPSDSSAAWKWLQEYFTANPDFVADILHKQFINDNYESEAAYLEEIEYENSVKNMCSQLIKYIKKNGGSMKKTDILKYYEAESDLCSAALSRLEQSNRIVRSKVSNRIVFSIPSK